MSVINDDYELFRSLLDAIRANDVEKASWLIELGANINHTEEDGCTILHYSVDGGLENFDNFYVFLKNGADVTILNADGETALDSARRQRRHLFYDVLQPLTRDTAVLRYALEVAIALAPLRLDPYVVLAILDLLTVELGKSVFNIADVREIKKVRVLTGVQHTQNRLLAARFIATNAK